MNLNPYFVLSLQSPSMTSWWYVAIVNMTSRVTKRVQSLLALSSLRTSMPRDDALILHEVSGDKGRFKVNLLGWHRRLHQQANGNLWLLDGFIWWKWWHHGIQMLSVSPTLCERNPPVTGEFVSQKTSNSGLWCLFCYQAHRVVDKQSFSRWFEMPWRPCDVLVVVAKSPEHQHMHGIGCVGQTICIVVPELFVSTWVKLNPSYDSKYWYIFHDFLNKFSMLRVDNVCIPWLSLTYVFPLCDMHHYVSGTR